MSLLIPSERQLDHYIAVLRNDGETWEDISSYVSSIDINNGSFEMLGTGSSGADTGIITASFNLANEDRYRFNPDDEGSLFNIFNNQYNPLIYFNREIVFDVKIEGQKTFKSETLITKYPSSDTTYELILLEEGSYNITIVAYDKSGNHVSILILLKIEEEIIISELEFYSTLRILLLICILLPLFIILKQKLNSKHVNLVKRNKIKSRLGEIKCFFIARKTRKM